MREIEDVVVLEDYKLLLTFDNLEKKIYDMSNELDGVFEYLKDYDAFKSVTLVSGNLTWFRDLVLPENICNELDVCSDYAYLNSEFYGGRS